MSQKYVTHGAMLSCNQGTAPSTLQVTSNFTVTSQNMAIATELDKAPFVNIPPFAICRILTKTSPVPCAPVPIMWTNTHNTNKCVNAKTLLKKSTIQCAIGGKISISNPSQTIASTGAMVDEVKADVKDSENSKADFAETKQDAEPSEDSSKAFGYKVTAEYAAASLNASAMLTANFDNVNDKRATDENSESRKKLASDFYLKSDIPEDKIDSHLKGIDFSEPVKELMLKKGGIVVQYQRSGSPQGNYFTQSDQNSGLLGMDIKDRQAMVYRVKEDVIVLESVTADFTTILPDGTKVTYPGGAKQYFTTDKSKFELIN